MNAHDLTDDRQRLDDMATWSHVGHLPIDHGRAVELATEARQHVQPGPVSDLWRHLLTSFIEATTDADRQHARAALSALHLRSQLIALARR